MPLTSSSNASATRTFVFALHSKNKHPFSFAKATPSSRVTARSLSLSILFPITIFTAGTGRFLAMRNGYYGAGVDVLEPGPGPCSASGVCACKKGFGGPTCSQPLCDPGVKNACNDGNQCTVGVCGANGTCQQKYINEVCDDGDPCTFNEICVIGKCIGPLTPLCDDFDACTVDTCDGKGGCLYTPIKGCQ